MNYLKFKLIDAYIAKKFLGTFFFAIILIISIAIVFDLAEQIDEFIERKAPMYDILFRYYLNFIPYFINLFTPLLVFISVIFFTSKMAQNTEIIAILSSGTSFKRMLVPYFLSAFLITIISLFLSNYVIPNANKELIEFKKEYIWNTTRNYDRNIHKQIRPGILIYMESYSTEFDIGYKFTLEQIVDGKLKSKLISDMIQYDSLKEIWTIKNYYIRDFYEDGEKINKGESIDTVLDIHPSDFKRRIEFLDAMNYFELNDFIEEQKLQGSPNIVAYQIQKYQRISNPFSTFILTLIGISVASRKTRGGTGMHIGIGLLLSFSYILFLQMSTNFAIGGTMPPILGVWLPNIFYTIIGFVMYKMAPK